MALNRDGCKDKRTGGSVRGVVAFCAIQGDTNETDSVIPRREGGTRTAVYHQFMAAVATSYKTRVCIMCFGVVLVF